MKNLDYEDSELVLKALGQLTERQLLVFALWLAGFGAKEIARLLGLSEGTVKRHLNRARQKMRQFAEAYLIC